MKDINLAKVLACKRREKGVTQEQLADFIGVSKASVSKWETGQSYPDLTILPQLAAYFGISIDELMDYKPQLSREKIRKLYVSLSAEFASRPFDDVLSKCRELIKKYYSCWPFLLQMGLLLLNHTELVRGPDEAKAIILEAEGLFRRARLESDDADVVRKAVYLEALCRLYSFDSSGVLKLLGEKVPDALPPELLIASAYRVSGRTNEAAEVLQAGIFQNITILINFMSSYLSINTENPSKFDETLRRALAVAEAFDMKKLHPGVFASFLLVAAQGFIATKRPEKALEFLELYTETVTGNIYPIKLHGDSYFNLLDRWLEELDLGENFPRSENTIRRSMADAVSKNPAFSALSDNPRFGMLLDRLQGNLRENN